MAQAIMNKDIRKNCIDVEKVIKECFSESQMEEIQVKTEPINIKKLSKKLIKWFSNYNAKNHQELITLNQVKQRLYYGYYEVELMKCFRK